MLNHLHYNQRLRFSLLFLLRGFSKLHPILKVRRQQGSHLNLPGL